MHDLRITVPDNNSHILVYLQHDDVFLPNSVTSMHLMYAQLSKPRQQIIENTTSYPDSVASYATLGQETRLLILPIC